MRIFSLSFFVLWISVGTRALLAGEAARLSVVEGTITWLDTDRSLMVLQDGSNAMAFRMDSLTNLAIGQAVELAGKSAPLIAAFPNFPDHAAAREQRSSFEEPANQGTYYLSRMCGWLQPPATGQYTFWIASDDSSELWLSTNSDPANIRKIAFVENGRWTNPREWDRFPAQRSHEMKLVAGQSYYVEAVGQQSRGKDCLAAAWQGPGLKRAVIEGRYLFPWTPFSDSHEEDAARTGILWEYWDNCYLSDLSVLRRPDPCIRWFTGTQLVRSQAGGWPSPMTINSGQVLPPEQNFRRVEIEGRLAFLSQHGQQAEMELSDGLGRSRVCFKGDPALVGAIPENALVRVTGVVEAVRGEDGQWRAGVVWVNNPAVDIAWAETDANWALIKPMPMHALSESNPSLAAGQWVRTRGMLVRSGDGADGGVWQVQGEDTFEGYSSTNGTDWTPAGPPVEMMMNRLALMGFAVASHQTGQSAEIHFDQVAGLPGALQGTEIGGPECNGAVRATGNSYVVRGCGNGLWSGADQCFFGWHPLAGDAEVVAHVVSFTSSDAQAKAGLMIRESLDDNAAWAAMVCNPLNAAGLQARREAGKNAAGAISAQPATWLKLRRHRNVYAAQIEDASPPQAGEMVELVGRLSWTNNALLLCHAHYRDLATEPAALPDDAPARPSVGGALPDVRIKDLATEAGKAVLAGRSAHGRIRGTVTFNREVGGKPLFIVQDDSGGCSVQMNGLPVESVAVGQVIELTGPLEGGGAEFRANGLAVWGESALPQPLIYPFSPLIKEQAGCRWTEAEGVGREVSDGRLLLMTSGGLFPVDAGNLPTHRLAKYINALVKVRGVYWPSEPARLLLPAEQFIEIEEPSPENPFAIPTFSTASLQTFNPDPGLARRVKVAGVVTCLRAGSLWVQDQAGGIRVDTAGAPEIHVGDPVAVAGFAFNQAAGLRLSEAVVRRETVGAVPVPVVLEMKDLGDRKNNDLLVRLEAVVLEQRLLNGMQTLDLQAGPREFQAALPLQQGHLPGFIPGSTVRITGVHAAENFAGVAERERPNEPHDEPLTSVAVLLRSPADVVILQRPPWWNWKYTATVIGAALAALLGTLLWIRTLRRRVEQRTGELRQAMVRLQKETQISATLAERDRLAGEIHDSVEQGLSAIMMQMEAAAKLQDQPEEMARYLALARNMANFSRSEVQHVVWNLQSPMLENVDLPTALRRVAGDISAGDSPRVTVEVSGQARPLPSVVEHHLLRIGQEALTNAVKHAAAKTIAIRMAYEPDRLVFIVSDDGGGFNPDMPGAGGGHFGLLGMRTRAKKINAVLTIASQPNSGTTIELAVPLEHAAGGPII